jgi:hypothetical protein
MIGKNKRRTDPKSKLCKHSWGGENGKESQEPTHVQSPIAPPSDLLLVKFVNDIDSQTRKLLFECKSSPLVPNLQCIPANPCWRLRRVKLSLVSPRAWR